MRRAPGSVALLIGVLAVVIGGFGLAGCGGDGEPAATEEIFLEPVATDGPEPFTRSVATEETALRPPADPANEPTRSEGVEAVDGGTVGLFGGTLDQGACDPEQLVAFLEANPSKASAWARVQGITAEGIPAFVATLTPVVLRNDTRVTNHGYLDGRATPRQAVLQAGTAVMVDQRGVPRVRCACGNPLVEPDAAPAAYTGDSWRGFDEGALQVVRPAPAPLTVVVLVDVDSGAQISRPVGTDGGEDRPVTAAPSSSEVVLDLAGLGVTGFGDDRATASAALEAALGPPVTTRDLDPDPAGELGCTVPVTVSEWSNGLTVYFDTSTDELFAYVTAWDYENGPPTGSDAPLATPEGVKLGSSEAEVLATYPGTTVVRESNPDDGEYGDTLLRVPLRTALTARADGGITVLPDERLVSSIFQYRGPSRCPFGT